jgi:hypothetical protein
MMAICSLLYLNIVVLTNKCLSHREVTNSKLFLFTATECVSSLYKIWNSEAEVPSVADMPVQDLQKLLIE